MRNQNVNLMDDGDMEFYFREEGVRG